jgi:NAD(P)-dependent dehydrogenase (short-subunit alcohol dehydrogenase family)
MNRLQGKFAVITGGRRGIGLATAKAFPRAGARVVVVGRNQMNANQAWGLHHWRDLEEREPFDLLTQRLVDTAGRIEKFERRYRGLSRRNKSL